MNPQVMSFYDAAALPALQVNIRAGELPPPDANGIRYLRLPLNQLGDLK